jgi:uncharacterized membrane protein YfcA
MNQLFYIILGIAGGTLSGMFGIGGGIILVPALVYIFGLSQHQAQGTSLAALLPPVALFAVMRYYANGNVKIGIAALICVGFLLGGLIGATVVQNWSAVTLKRLFGVLMFLVSVKMILGK